MAIIRRLGQRNTTAVLIPDVPPVATRVSTHQEPNTINQNSRLSAGRPDLYQEATDKILEVIKAGTAPWNRRWDSQLRWPINGVTNRQYHGINIMLLLDTELQDHRWCTYKMAQEQGWQVRAGEKGSDIYFYKPYIKKTGETDPVTGEPETVSFPMLKRYKVFNFSQMNGAPAIEWHAHEPLLDDATAQICQEIIEATGADIRHGYRKASYSLSKDIIYMPDMASFQSDAYYYATILHEIAHWTAHPSRLNRTFGKSSNADEYAKEELRAEITSAMISMQLNLPNQMSDHAAYIDHYINILKGDKKEFFRAARDAEKIMRSILSYHPQFREDFENQHQIETERHLAAGAPAEMFNGDNSEFLINNHNGKLTPN